MKKLVVKINDYRGIHARSAIALCNVAEKYNSEILVTNEEKTAKATDIIDVLSLNAKFQSEIVIMITGEDEVDALSEISQLFILFD